jgi:hypothetical protein
MDEDEKRWQQFLQGILQCAVISSVFAVGEVGFGGNGGWAGRVFSVLAGAVAGGSWIGWAMCREDNLKRQVLRTLKRIDEIEREIDR